ncbi:MAG: phosphatidate cytidylyltransferase [Proteobacteria bacterium SG_bin9]|nr:MAG: phosphatidate cytidylyltransferase [Proteobacteria bacterium SG_bin9]
MAGDSTAPQAAETPSRNLLMRVLAALVLAPITIAIAWLGGWPWLWLVTIAAAILYYEWQMIVGVWRNRFIMATGIAALGIAGPLLMIGEMKWLSAVLAAACAILALLARAQSAWVVGGFLYATAAFLGAIIVRADVAYGFVALVFVLLVVWAADIGGYFAGRGIGGPKLWPRVSPKKTWSGAIGGLLASLAIAAGFAAAGQGALVTLLVLGAVLSVVSQLGDLFESAIKRQFGVKDSSHIIPGHGGLMDRLDGFIAAIAFAALVGALRGGVDGAGRGLMVW